MNKLKMFRYTTDDATQTKVIEVLFQYQVDILQAVPHKLYFYFVFPYNKGEIFVKQFKFVSIHCRFLYDFQDSCAININESINFKRFNVGF